MEPEGQRSVNVKCYMLIHLWTYCRSNSAVGPHCLKQKSPYQMLVQQG